MFCIYIYFPSVTYLNNGGQGVQHCDLGKVLCCYTTVRANVLTNQEVCRLDGWAVARDT